MYVAQKEPQKKIKSGVPQDSVMDSLLPLIFVNDLQHVIKFLNPKMFAVNTNIFYSNSIIIELFENLNLKVVYKCLSMIRFSFIYI